MKSSRNFLLLTDVQFSVLICSIDVCRYDAFFAIHWHLSVLSYCMDIRKYDDSPSRLFYLK